MGTGVVEVVEAAYAVGDGDGAWLRAMSERVIPLLGRGLGVHAYVYDLTGADKFRTLQHITVEADDAWRAQWTKLLDTAQGREFLHVVHRHQPRISSLGSFMDQAGPPD